MNHFGSLDEAVRVARSNVRFDGGGRWRVYGMRLQVLAGGSGAQSVRDRLLAEGLEPGRGRGDPEERVVRPPLSAASAAADKTGACVNVR